jgi:predicted DNA-binding protein
MPQLLIFLTPEENNKLKELAKKKGMAKSDLLQGIIKEGVEKANGN